MSTQLPYPLPEGYTSSPYWNNPSQTNPFPAPAGLPYQAWSTPRTTVTWTAPPTDPLDSLFTEAAYWQSPLFDLRPELRGSDGARQTGVPIWGALFAFLLKEAKTEPPVTEQQRSGVGE